MWVSRILDSTLCLFQDIVKCAAAQEMDVHFFRLMLSAQANSCTHAGDGTTCQPGKDILTEHCR